MEQITRGESRREAVRVGVDLAKRVIQVHAVDLAGRVLTSRALARDRFIEWCAPIRQYLPKGTCLRELTQRHCNSIARQLNNRPRLRLGFKTPCEVLARS